MGRKLALALALLLVLSADASGYPKAIGLADLKGWWPFEEGSGTTANDRTGRGTGTLTNGPTYVTGRFGYGLRFDGSNDRVDIANESVYDFETTDRFSLCAWFRTNASDSNNFIIGKQATSGAFQGYNIRLTGAKMEFALGGSTSGVALITTNSSFNDNKWHLVVATYDGNPEITKMKIFIDGLNQGTTSSSNNLVGSLLNDGALKIGIRSDNALPFGPGDIDDVRVYSRRLSATEISQMWQSGRRFHGR